ncbi:YwpF family protein [Pseudogracilibacillus sp. SE30717A]|uniref:YwpF family protein n=1 Tax=Pseudogracilibacillus sp. SE30717A TaxID=3098293 RepID=UPI00300E3B1F
MKTFKLKGLKIMANEEDGVERKQIPLHDGLVINREDKFGWLIEAYIDKIYLAYFNKVKNVEELMIQVKITREDNDPAFFITKVIGINQINEDRINVLFQGEVVDHRKSRIEEMLQMIIEEGYQGESLLKKFKELI